MGYEKNPREISVEYGNKRLIAAQSKLQAAGPETYAQVYGKNARISFSINDFSGQQNVVASANLEPNDVLWWYRASFLGIKEFELTSEKIQSFKSDANGIAPVTKMLIKRAQAAKDGSPARYPWYIKIENGTGGVKRNELGGASIAPGTYNCSQQAWIRLDDFGVFSLLSTIITSMLVWLHTAPLDSTRQGIAGEDQYYSRRREVANAYPQWNQQHGQNSYAQNAGPGGYGGQNNYGGQGPQGGYNGQGQPDNYYPAPAPVPNTAHSSYAPGEYIPPNGNRN